MAYIFKKYDDNKRKQGAWINIDGGKFRVSSYAHSETQKQYQEVKDRNEAEYGDQEPPLEVRIADEARVMAETLLHDWEGVSAHDDEGNVVAVPFTRENAYELLLNDDPLRDRIIKESMRQANFERDKIAKQTKKQ